MEELEKELDVVDSDGSISMEQSQKNQAENPPSSTQNCDAVLNHHEKEPRKRLQREQAVDVSPISTHGDAPTKKEERGSALKKDAGKDKKEEEKGSALKKDAGKDKKVEEKGSAAKKETEKDKKEEEKKSALKKGTEKDKKEEEKSSESKKETEKNKKGEEKKDKDKKEEKSSASKKSEADEKGKPQPEGGAPAVPPPPPPPLAPPLINENLRNSLSPATQRKMGDRVPMQEKSSRDQLLAAIRSSNLKQLKKVELPKLLQ
uniref:WH2 domain-containing protein n=1 Tax=Meleagris gallopavo TaxID=9103 RepID=A0A803Y5Q2_MELGA